MTKSNIIGYAAAFPIPEVVRGINAFTRGVRSVNSQAKVRVVWTNTWYNPASEKEAAKALLDAGWDGSKPVLAICPINPFFWPVKPSIGRWFAHSVFGAYKKSYYRTIYFHRSGRNVDVAYERYLWFHSRLKQERYPTLRQLAEKFEISPRQAAREIDFMRS